MKARVNLVVMGLVLLTAGMLYLRWEHAQQFVQSLRWTSWWAVAEKGVLSKAPLTNHGRAVVEACALEAKTDPKAVLRTIVRRPMPPDSEHVSDDPYEAEREHRIAVIESYFYGFFSVHGAVLEEMEAALYGGDGGYCPKSMSPEQWRTHCNERIELLDGMPEPGLPK